MVDSIYYLKPNYDSSQDMAWPDGDKPDVPNVPPGAVQDLYATTLGPYSIELDWTEVPDATNYNIQRSPDNLIWSNIDATAAPPYTSGNLNPETPYWFRVFSENATGWGPASNTATNETDAASSSPGDIFCDDFALQPIGVTVGSGLNPPTGDANARWWYFGQDYGETCTVETNKAHSDTKSLQFDFIARSAESRCEAGFKLGSVHQQLSIEFQLYIPNGAEHYGGAAYKHRYIGSAGTNCKIFRLYHTDYGNKHKVGASLWRVDDNTSQLSLDFAVPGGVSSLGPRYNIITAATRGNWIKLRFDITGCSVSRQTTVTAFLNDSQIITHTYDQYNAAWPTGFDRGYLLGTFNTGFDEQTTLIVDSVSMVTL